MARTKKTNVEEENNVILCDNCLWNKDKVCIHNTNLKIEIARKVQKIEYKHGVDLTSCDYFKGVK